MDDDINFCPRCGKNLTAGALYCPACGAGMGDPNVQSREEMAMDAKNEGRINMAVIILMVGAALSIMSGLYTYFTLADSVQAMFELIDSMAPGLYTEESLRSMLELSCVITIVCGSMGIVAALLALKRRFWIAVMILAIIASPFGLFICLISAYLLYKARAAFKD